MMEKSDESGAEYIKLDDEFLDTVEKALLVKTEDLFKVETDKMAFTGEMLLKKLKSIEDNYFDKLRAANALQTGQMKPIKKHFRSEAHDSDQENDGLVSPIYERQYREKKPRTVSPICLVRIKTNKTGTSNENGKTPSAEQSLWYVKRKPKNEDFSNSCSCSSSALNKYDFSDYD